MYSLMFLDLFWKSWKLSSPDALIFPGYQLKRVNYMWNMSLPATPPTASHIIDKWQTVYAGQILSYKPD